MDGMALKHIISCGAGDYDKTNKLNKAMNYVYKVGYTFVQCSFYYFFTLQRYNNKTLETNIFMKVSKVFDVYFYVIDYQYICR